MSEIKERKATSDWIKYELETKELDPPIVELKLSPLESITDVDNWSGGMRMRLFSEVVLQKAMICVADWKLTQNGEPLDIKNRIIKERVLRRLLGEKLKGKKELLGNAIMEYAQNLDNFSKN